MDETIFNSITKGAEQGLTYLASQKSGKPVPAGYEVHCFHPPITVDVQSIRKKTGMTQKDFAATFGFSLNTLKHWEGGQRTPEGPARVLLTLIERNPKGVMDILHG